VKHQIITVNNATATTIWLFFPAKTIIIKIGFARACRLLQVLLNPISQLTGLTDLLSLL